LRSAAHTRFRIPNSRFQTAFAICTDLVDGNVYANKRLFVKLALPFVAPENDREMIAR
jgi:hypothetical protein